MSTEDIQKQFKEAVVTKQKFKVQINAAAYAYTYVEVEAENELDALQIGYDLLTDPAIAQNLAKGEWNYILDDCSPFEVDEAFQI
jgi:hypothetical protein